MCISIFRKKYFLSILREYIEIIWIRFRLIVNKKNVWIKKLTSKMVEPPKSGVQMVIFLTKIDFSISMISLNLHDLERTFISLRIIGKTCFFLNRKVGVFPKKFSRQRVAEYVIFTKTNRWWKRPKLFSLILQIPLSALRKWDERNCYFWKLFTKFR